MSASSPPNLQDDSERRRQGFAKHIPTVDDTDEGRLEAEEHMASTLGTIEVRVFRVREQGTGSFQTADMGPRAFELAEVSLKGRAITHGTVFKDATE